MSRWYSSSGPQGVTIIADIEILVGIAYIIIGIFVLIASIIPGVVFLALGPILICMGWALDKLEIWAWWGSLLINATTFVGNYFFGGDYLQIIISAVIIIYLMTPGVRDKFFP
ncbi:MAG: hypothetical protein ACFFD6_01610 [Candidatus Thorarchaeota archaeon]